VASIGVAMIAALAAIFIVPAADPVHQIAEETAKDSRDTGRWCAGPARPCLTPLTDTPLTDTQGNGAWCPLWWAVADAAGAARAWPRTSGFRRRPAATCRNDLWSVADYPGMTQRGARRQCRSGVRPWAS
jgi:hypothetical protein